MGSAVAELLLLPKVGRAPSVVGYGHSIHLSITAQNVPKGETYLVHHQNTKQPRPLCCWILPAPSATPRRLGAVQAVPLLPYVWFLRERGECGTQVGREAVEWVVCFRLIVRLRW